MAYPVLYHNELDIKSVEKTFSKTLHQLQEGDFKSADVRKMGDTIYYRARLDLRDRLLFSLILFHGEKHLLLLEVIKDHNYARSRFLRGAQIPEDDKLVSVPNPEKELNGHAPELTYLNASNRSVHLLNKFISFDELQQSVFLLHSPLIIIGSAGSGKTALVLEKMKTLPGNVAYISLSKFLVDHASALYFGNGYDNKNQEAEFLSLNDYLASWNKPQGREIHFHAFEPWFARHAQALKINEPYRVYEEFKGVITGSPVHAAWLTKEEYLSLGVKQSIFNLDEREKLYTLFQKYMVWLNEYNWYDSNIICYEYLALVKPRYDYVVVDEVQDITNIQLKCILQSLTRKTSFILTGDSNQIVHPNFFSWSKVKTFFHQSGNAEKQIKILQTNYRNSRQVVQLSNILLKIKNSRFGSIDRESNYLVNTISQHTGEVLLYGDEDKKKNELNRRTQQSAHFAVIVTDNVYKDEARRYFKTPLVFSVQEAKGLEYENVILVNFVSNHEAEFREIIYGVSAEDLEQTELHYNRASSKYDKDAEIYKFYINSFYVAITRGIKNIYLFEKRITHPVLQLLQLQESKKEIQVAEIKSSREEWLEEARRLSEQGKYEQSEQIRAKYLGYEYISAEQLEVMSKLALDPAKKEEEVKKERKQLFQYAIHHQRLDWIDQLAILQFQRAILYMKEVRLHRREFVKNIRMGRRQDVLSTINKYNIGFTSEEGATAIMLALHYDQPELATELLKRNASIRQNDPNGWLPIDYLLHGYYKNKLLKHQQVASLKTLQQFWYLVKPQGIIMEVDNHQLYIGGNSMLFFLVMAMRTLQADHPNKVKVTRLEDNKEEFITGAFSMDDIEKLASLIPDEILPPYRKNRSYINSILSSNEISRREQPGCKFAFQRVQRGWYMLNPDIKWSTS
ncbi:MAG: UvrD-helicase domain-containing protein [Chitinophagaceae bacterium]